MSEEEKLQQVDIAENSNSLVARASQIMAIIIGLGLISMISSMLVSESLSGDAEKINRAGQLRMFAVKISRADLLNREHDQTSAARLQQAQQQFDLAFIHLFDGGLTDELDDPELRSQYQKVAKHWEILKLNRVKLSLVAYDQFVEQIDGLVLLIQQESESKIGLLRAIHVISLLSVIIVAFVVLSRINRNIVSPLKKLIRVASAAGKGDFSLRSDYKVENELGLLSRTINQMSEELKLTHAEFEQRVEIKTSALSRSNQTLAMLYDTSKRLSEDTLKETEKEILIELEGNLGFGRVTIKPLEKPLDDLSIDIATDSTISHGICFKRIVIPVKKQSKTYNHLVWEFDSTKKTEEWQLSLIETIAEMLASARAHEQDRLAENRLVIIEERAVIARELHDSLAQSLSYLKIQVALLTKKLDKQLSREQIDSTVEDIHLGLNRAYLQLRELLTTFRLKIEDPSLENALTGTVAEFSSKSEHPIELEFDLNNKSLSANQEIHVLQIVREALSNVQRHANAKSAKVSVVQKAEGFIVSIFDDGIGMKKEHQLEGHFGLGIMQERAKSLNAIIKIKSELDKGTKIEVTF